MTRFRPLFAVSLVATGFAAGILYIMSCGSGTTADAAVASMKYTRVYASGATSVACPAGSYVMGGGCMGIDGSCAASALSLVIFSAPKSTTAWGCRIGCAGSGGVTEGTASNTISYALCASWSPTDAVTITNSAPDF